LASVLLTEDRQQQGLILDWGIGRNITLPELRRMQNTACCRKARSARCKYGGGARGRESGVPVLQGVRFPAETCKKWSAQALNSSLRCSFGRADQGVDVGAKAAIYS
jgi:rhamnose transport system ATP-binding protein